jgi:hypothetical protein
MQGKQQGRVQAASMGRLWILQLLLLGMAAVVIALGMLACMWTISIPGGMV